MMLMIICVPPLSLCITLKGEYTVIITWRGVEAVRPSDFPSQLYQIPFTPTQSHPTTYLARLESLVSTSSSSLIFYSMCLLSPFSIIFSASHILYSICLLSLPHALTISYSLFYLSLVSASYTHYLLISILSVSSPCLLYSLYLNLYSICLLSLHPKFTISNSLFYLSLESISLSLSIYF